MALGAGAGARGSAGARHQRATRLAGWALVGVALLYAVYGALVGWIAPAEGITPRDAIIGTALGLSVVAFFLWLARAVTRGRCLSLAIGAMALLLMASVVGLAGAIVVIATEARPLVRLGIFVAYLCGYLAYNVATLVALVQARRRRGEDRCTSSRNSAR